MKCSYQIAGHPVYRFSMPVIDSNMYLIPDGDSCLVVDPCVSAEAEELMQILHIQNCVVLLTHEHYDHISGVSRLRELLSCQVICSAACGERITDSRKNCAAYSNALVIAKSEAEQRLFTKLVHPNYVCYADRTYTGQMELIWKDMTLTLREAPGHSPGSQVIEIAKHWYFTGDSLIPGKRIITRLPGGSKKAYAEVTRIYLESIAAGSILFPGHGGETLYNGILE